MNTAFYIPRTLIYQDTTLTEAELLRDRGVAVVLAEPGSGKTVLLDNIASRFKVIPQKASIFKEKRFATRTDVLVLDALDEVARLDSSGLQAVLVKAQETGASRVILASRSSEWEESRSFFIKDCFGTCPRVAYLRPFNDAEQEQLFLHHMPGEDFSKFKRELSKYDLDNLLGNPMFLILFAEAYVESGKCFITKKQIFDDAVRRLTCEANPTVLQKNRPSIATITRWASEIFAKLLLSGAVGVSIGDKLDQRHFPRLTSLLSENNDQAHFIVDTRLLKPSTYEGEHEPVHRIVAEYCAARYLAGRIDDSTDLLTLKRCLAIIAPNSVVRDELRGLLGWMAAMGSRTLQEAAIDLDPYAVLANGDPSLLLPSSSRKLLERLREAAEQDPNFRRGDRWRTFSLSGFFNDEIMEEVKPLLASSNGHERVRNLLLEMLNGSDAVPGIISELRALMLDPNNSLQTRRLAHRNLIAVGTHNHKSDSEALIKESGHDATRICSEMFQMLGVEALGRGTLLALLRNYAELRLEPNDAQHSYLSCRINSLIKDLKLSHVEWLLDQLTEGLACTCGAVESCKCDCRNGISRIAGRLLDCYFEKKQSPFNPVTIWQWVKNFNFPLETWPSDSQSIGVLWTDSELRQSIQRHALGGVADSEEIQRIRRVAFGSGSHLGLLLQHEDTWAMVDFAFESNNPALWASFHAGHNSRGREQGPDALRAHMRCQANQKLDFMRAWAKQEFAWESRTKELRISDSPHRRRIRRLKRQEKETRFDNLQYLKSNRALIESGRHWGWLKRFAKHYLMTPDKLNELVDDPQLPENALCNCLPLIEPKLPSLQELAEHQGDPEVIHVEMLLYAACLASFRRHGSLAGLKRSTLEVLKTNIEVHYRAVDQDTRNRLKAEIDGRLCWTDADARRFVQEYLEPQLRKPNREYAQVDWLRQPEFSSLRDALPLEWLMRFPGASLRALEVLFQIVVEQCDETTVLKVIRFHMRYVGNSFFWPGGVGNQNLEARRLFWSVRSFFFEKDCSEEIEQWLKSDPDIIFELERRFSPYSGRENKGWPSPSARKVYLILDAFIGAWPKVHLPDSWSTGDPKEETAYRFLRDIVRTIGKDDPDNSLSALDSIIADVRFDDFHDALRMIKAAALRKKALRDFEAPAPSRITEFLDANQVGTVEGLRALLIEVLEEFQGELKGSEFDPVGKFYSGGKRVDEVTASKRIAEYIQLRLKALNIPVAVEHQLKNAKRCDITATLMLDGSRKLLVTEVKGQWSPELYTASKEQLHQRYAIHPDAQHQGIYLVLWFGGDEKIAGKRDVSIRSPYQLKEKVIAEIPEEMHGLIDVFVLDLSAEKRIASSGRNTGKQATRTSRKSTAG